MARVFRLLVVLSAVLVVVSASATNLPPGSSLAPPAVTEITDPGLSTGTVIFEGVVPISFDGVNGVYRDRVIVGPAGNLIFMDAFYNGFDSSLNPISTSGGLLSIAHSSFAGFTVDAAWKQDGLVCPVVACSIVPPFEVISDAAGSTLTWRYNVVAPSDIGQWTLAGTDTTHFNTNGTADLTFITATGGEATLHLTGIAQPSLTPEPGTLLLLSIGAGFSLLRRRQRG